MRRRRFLLYGCVTSTTAKRNLKKKKSVHFKHSKYESSARRAKMGRVFNMENQTLEYISRLEHQD